MPTISVQKNSQYSPSKDYYSPSKDYYGANLWHLPDKNLQPRRDNEPIQRLLKSLDNENRRRQLNLQDYLNSLRSEAGNDFSELVLNLAWEIWEKLSQYFQDRSLCLIVPDACPGYRDNLMYTWSRGEHYLECEIFGNGEIEFFYRNRKNDKSWGEDILINEDFSEDIIEKLKLFAW